MATMQDSSLFGSGFNGMTENSNQLKRQNARLLLTYGG